jgi:phosphoglucosamine mutase
MCDEKGQVMDGDQIMALIATSWHRQGLLRGNSVVSTVMSNLGLETYLQGLGIALVRTKVGDKHVCDYMRTHDCNVGGEQSGHIILSDYARTGDGLVAALQVLSVLVHEKKPASEIGRVFQPVPQILKNVRLREGDPLASPTFQQSIQEMEHQLGAQGRLLVRKSGTEPLVRIMAEGFQVTMLESVIERLVTQLAQENFVEKVA